MCCEVYSRLIYSLPNSRIMSLHNSTLVQMEKRCLLFSDYLCSLLPFKAMKRWFFFDQRLILICVASQIAFIGIRYRAHLFVKSSMTEQCCYRLCSAESHPFADYYEILCIIWKKTGVLIRKSYSMHACNYGIWLSGTRPIIMYLQHWFNLYFIWHQKYSMESILIVDILVTKINDSKGI